MNAHVHVAVQSGARIARIPALDGLRGVAVLAVMAYHGTHVVQGGFLGVDVFFALSGFLITALLLRERCETGRIALRRFYARRALRLLPALLVLLAVYLLVCAVFDRARLGRHALDAASVALYAGNAPRALQIARPVYLAPCWSLAVEEHFYLLWPLALSWLAARVPSARRLAALIALCAALAWLARAGRLALGVHPNWLYYTLDGRADGLLIGGALGALHGTGALPGALPKAARRALRFGLPVALLALCGLLFTAQFHDRANHLWRFAFVAFATAAVIHAALEAPDGFTTRVLSSRPLAALGALSYGLYLWHYPIYLALARDLRLPLPQAFATGTLLSFAAAWLSYRYVERPFLERKQRLM